MNQANDSAACDRVRGRLDELLEGTLAGLDRARDEGHLEACGACRTALAERRSWFAEVRAALAAGDEELAAAAAGLDERLARLPAPALPDSARAGRRHLRPALRAAAVAASALLALSILRSAGAFEQELGSALAAAAQEARSGIPDGFAWTGSAPFGGGGGR